MRKKFHKSELLQNKKAKQPNTQPKHKHSQQHKGSLSCMNRVTPALFPLGLEQEYSYNPGFLWDPTLVK